MVIATDSLTIARLSETHLPILANFNCLRDNEFSELPNKKRRRTQELSIEMNNFLKNEALDEQTSGLNNTFLLFYHDLVIGYVSLCADAIKLNTEEQESSGVFYETVPSLKVARLAVDQKAQRIGIGKKLLKFSIATALNISNNYCGVKFLTLDCYPHRLSYYEGFGFVSNEVHNMERQNHPPISMRLDIYEYLEKMTG